MGRLGGDVRLVRLAGTDGRSVRDAAAGVAIMVRLATLPTGGYFNDAGVVPW
jgi:hypothetical protein